MKDEPSVGASETSVKKKVKDVVAEVFHKNSNELSDETSFVKDLHAKSANILELIAMLEDEFSLELRFAEVMKNSTIGAAAQYIEGRLRTK